MILIEEGVSSTPDQASQRQMRRIIGYYFDTLSDLLPENQARVTKQI